MNVIQAIRRNSNRKAIEQIRELQPRLNQGYREIEALRRKLTEKGADK